VIGCSARSDEREALTARNAAQVGIEFDRAVSRNQRTPLFGAEDAMDKIARVCMGHDAPSRDSGYFIGYAHPTLKRGANNRCAYGANFYKIPINIPLIPADRPAALH